MELDSAGAGGRVTKCGLLDEFVYFGPMGQGVYGSFLENLATIGYQQGSNLFVFDYDWRKSAFDNAAALESFIEDIIRDAKLGEATQFDILGHSFGGLVATVYANEHKKAEGRIYRLITVGTPFLGSAELFQSLQVGWGSTQQKYVSMRDVRKTALSFPSLYELIPRYRNCCALGSQGSAVPFDTLSVKDWMRLAWTEEAALSEDALQKHIDRVKRLMEVIAKPAKGYTPVRLTGTQVHTVSQVYFLDGRGTDPARAIYDRRKDYDGDGVVLVLSATGGIQPLTLPGFTAHDQLMSDRWVHMQLASLLKNRVFPENIKGSSPSILIAGRGRVPVTGVGIEADKRVMRPAETGELAVTIRFDLNSASLDTLRAIKLKADVVDPLGNRETFTLEVAGEVDSGVDPSGSYRSVNLRGRFQAPNTTGQSIVEVLLGDGTNVSWNFGVAL